MTSWAGAMFASGGINSLFQGINSAVQAKTNYHYSKKLWDYQTKNQYQNTVQDLYKAGLNPMLAVGGLSNSVGGSINASGGNSGIETGNSAIAQRAQIKIAEKQAETERLSAEAEVKEKEENIKYLQALTKRTNLLGPAENGLMVAQTEFHRQNILKTVSEIDKIYSDIQNNNRITDAQVTKLIEDAKHLRVITGNESINYDLLLRVRDSTNEAIKRDLMKTWFFQYLQGVSYGFELLGAKPSDVGFGVNNRGSYGIRFK